MLRIEPEISPDVTGALYAPSAAIVSPWEYGIALAETAVRNGTDLILSSEVLSIIDVGDMWVIHTSTGDIIARYIVNAAGVNSDVIHNMVAEPSFSIRPSKGSISCWTNRKAAGGQACHFPVPVKDHQRRVGRAHSPRQHDRGTERESDRKGRRFDLTGRPGLRAGGCPLCPVHILPGQHQNFAGIRANSDIDDFIIEVSAPRFVDLAGIKSPGLSAAPAIAVYAAELLHKEGLTLAKRTGWIGTRKKERFSELTAEEKNRIISEDPAYGRVICRCETVTEGEIIEALRSPIPARSVDGVKRSTGSGMGRCQGGFCGPRILEIIAWEYGMPPKKSFRTEGSYILAGQTKKERYMHA